MSDRLQSVEAEKGRVFTSFDFYWLSPNSLTLEQQTKQRLCDPNNAFFACFLLKKADTNLYSRLDQELNRRIDRFGGFAGGEDTSSIPEYISLLRHKPIPACNIGDRLHRIFHTQSKDILNVIIYDECHRLPGAESTASQFIRYLTSEEFENVIFIGVSATCENQLQVLFNGGTSNQAQLLRSIAVMIQEPPGYVGRKAFIDSKETIERDDIYQVVENADRKRRVVLSR